MGAAKDWSGTFQIPLFAFAVLMGLCALMACLATEPAKVQT
jgi:hypothetical protein